MNFHERLKQARKQKNKTQKDVAEYIGLTIKAYGFYELGQREPSIENLKKICDYLDVSADYLIGRSERC